MASTEGSSRCAALTSLADSERVDKPSDASGLPETDRTTEEGSMVAMVEDCDCGCGAGEGLADCTCGMEMLGSSSLFSS